MTGRKALVTLIIGLFLTVSAKAQFDFELVSEFDQFQGVWQVMGQKQLPLIADEEAPTGSILIFSTESSYVSDYIDPEYGASVDLQFSYSITNGVFECTMTGSNALGYYMQHENQAFTFKLSYSPDGKFLKLVNEEQRVYILERLENSNVNPSDDE